ncbi:hypothetical protein FHS18_005455 [Paenibacillus phyllosphaerae]|uniref:Carbohydrate-binding domain-containing protein n=1 Tax=Paenibacillus phyllosphaerae TaxID=274593 RepID=A0A7W5B2Q6_9BACL|nr:sugar-binding protein [Paenibacillus phyllosphaerae]MBB3113343.1 hypothetical protein [Paenibacillus phyllosphaerae]
MTRRRFKSLSVLVALMLAASLWGDAGQPSQTVFAQDRAPSEFQVSTFESADEGWAFGNGSEFPGAKGEFQVDHTEVYAGSGSGKLVGDFAGGGEYVSILKPLPSLDLDEFRLQVKSRELSALVLRVMDQTGQWHQQQLKLQDGGEWQTLTAESLDAGVNASHWGGANDGVWHGPAQNVMLLLNRSALKEGLTSGTVFFDQITALTDSEPVVIRQSVLGNVFSGSPASFTIESDPGNRLIWTVTDFWGKQVASSEVNITQASTAISLPKLATGYYHFHAEAWKGDTLQGSAENTFTIIPQAKVTDADSPFAVATHFGQSWNTDMIPLIKAAGFSAIRDEMDWGAVEQAKGVYSFDGKFNNYEQELRKHGTDPFVLLSYTNPHYDQNSTPYTDQGRQGFASYGTAVLNAFPDTRWVEVYNEFNIEFGDRGDGPADSLPEYYYKLLKETYLTLKAADPNVTVVGPATANMPWDWLEELFKLGGLDYMDVVSIHPYRYPISPETIELDVTRLDQLIRTYNNGKSKPIWASELGWPTQLDSRGISEETQASYIVRANAQSLASGIDKVFWYDFMNDGLDPNYNEHNFGIVRNADSALGKYAPKPAYTAFAIMTRELDGLNFAGKDPVTKGLYSYRFEQEKGKEKDTVRVMWSEETMQVALHTRSSLTVTDIMGVMTELKPDADGKVYLTLSGMPVYVKGKVESVSLNDRFAISNEGGIPGEQVHVTLTVDNTLQGTKALKGRFEINGVSVPLTVKAGEAAQATVSLPSIPNSQRVTGTIYSNDKPIGLVTSEIDMIEPLAYHIRHVRSDDGDAVRISITNRQSKDYKLNSIQWRIGESSGTDNRGLTVAARSEGHLDIPVNGLVLNNPAALSLTLYAEGEAPYSHEGTLIGVDPAALIGIPRGSYVIDGEADADAGVPLADLAKDGTVRINAYGGADDLSGEVRLAYDEEYLYLAANIKDDTQAQSETAGRIWMGDSVQIALSQGAPGEQQRWSELGLALTPEGPQLYRWSGGLGEQPGLIGNAQIQVKRDEASKLTVYELALPWSEITPIGPDDTILGFSFLVNDNDGQDRKGYIEWGSGIGAEKSSALFHAMKLLP